MFYFVFVGVNVGNVIVGNGVYCLVDLVGIVIFWVEEMFYLIGNVWKYYIGSF